MEPWAGGSRNHWPEGACRGEWRTRTSSGRLPSIRPGESAMPPQCSATCPARQDIPTIRPEQDGGASVNTTGTSHPLSSFGSIDDLRTSRLNDSLALPRNRHSADSAPGHHRLAGPRTTVSSISPRRRRRRSLRRMPPPGQGCAMDASLRGEAGLRLHVRLCVKDPDGLRKPMWTDPETTAGGRDGPAATAGPRTAGNPDEEGREMNHVVGNRCGRIPRRRPGDGTGRRRRPDLAPPATRTRRAGK